MRQTQYVQLQLPPKVSIILVSYNHADYIGEALDSIFCQDYDGEIELIVADDASSDGTVEIVQRYENRDARFHFRYLPNDVNLGITKNYQRAFAACTGKYIAIMEGDDIWLHRRKLSKQVALLEERSECVLCASNYFIWNQGAGRYSARTSVDPSGFMYIDTPFIINDNLPGNFSAIVYRADIVRKLPAQLYDIKAYDWAVNICAGMYGLLAYIHEPLSAYRVHHKGAWSGLRTVEKIREQIACAEQYNDLTGKLYDNEFNSLIQRLKYHELLAERVNTRGLRKVLRQVKGVAKALMPPILISVLRAILPPAVLSLVARL